MTGQRAQQRDILADRIFNDPSSWNAGSKDDMSMGDVIDLFPAVPHSARISKFSMLVQVPETSFLQMMPTSPCTPTAGWAQRMSFGGSVSAPTSPTVLEVPLVLFPTPSPALVMPQFLRVPLHPPLPAAPTKAKTTAPGPCIARKGSPRPLPRPPVHTLSRTPSAVRTLPPTPLTTARAV